MAPAPVYVKGGVWTNVEDQILKAAIQKYGTHQWSKVAALLHKKSARHCEIRWNEFLNPQLNFTGFSREEDTKLLTLARKLPNQWRTIADMMGRTAQICIERYNKLLSDGETEENAEDDDLRQATSLEFKVGDLNPHSDTRVAIPDKDELDEDEREMLAEARARLLNTRGSKATARVRERMLEDSKRIAELQKRRELKQAGIKLQTKKSKRKYEDEIDYNADIPYEQVPLPGIYDTKEENKRTGKELKKYEHMVQTKGIHEKLPEKEKPKHDRPKRGRKNEQAEEEQPVAKKARQSVKNDSHAFRNDAAGLHLSKPGTGSLNTSVSLDDALVISRNKLIESQATGAISQTPHSQAATSSSSRRSSSASYRQGNRGTLLTKKDLHKTLAAMFQSLPSPKNDFEIVLDVSDDEETPVEATTPPMSDHEQERTEELKLDCLEVRILPTPEFIEQPSTILDNTYNELLSNLITTTPYKVTETQSKIYSTLDKAIAVMSQGEHHPAISDAYNDKTSEQDIRSHISQTQDQITALRNQFTHIDGLVEHNTELNRELCLERLPLLRELQQGYYMNYRLFRDEKRALTRRTAQLNKEARELVPKPPK